MIVMVTGGAGYIGSHAVQRLIRDGHRVVAVDNLYRGNFGAIKALTASASGRLSFLEADITDTDTITRMLKARKVDAVMHFAALAYVGESVDEPLTYYNNNAAGALSVLRAVDAAGVSRFVFSSTCATYGEPTPKFIPIPETCPQKPINPYGRSKLHVEHMLFDYAAAAKKAGKEFGFAALRYFNVAGSDRTGTIGECHNPETHLIPIVLQAMLGLREKITIFGTDYKTPDGTCVRDYVHVEDLVDAHVCVLEKLEDGDARTYNLGIGKGYSVREIIDAARRVTGRDLTVEEGPRRPGDPPRLFANPAKIAKELGWKAQITDIDEIIASAWNWFEAHPDGYATDARDAKIARAAKAAGAMRAP
jgi:UDP-glucose 4-epimerase